MKKGFSLIELVVVVALTAILLSTASLSISKVKERRALEESKAKVIEVLGIYTDKAYHEAEEYKIKFDYDNKKIEVRDDLGNLKEEEDLPSSLKYTTVEGGSKLGSKTATVKASGWTSSFSIYIFNIDGESKYRVAIDGLNASDLTHINIYKNISASSATYSNIVKYHDEERDEDDPTDNGKWEKE